MENKKSKLKKKKEEFFICKKEIDQEFEIKIF